MKPSGAAAGRWRQAISSPRSQHLVFLAHVWACSPFLALWLRDPAIHEKLGDAAIASLRPFAVGIFAYLALRTWLAVKDPAWLRWEYVFPPLDVALISIVLFVSHRGPLSNLTLLYFLPIIEAAGSLSVRWAALTGGLVVVGAILATLNVPPPSPDVTVSGDIALKSSRELFQLDPLNVIFRVYFLMVISSLMAFQASIAAQYRSRAEVEADRGRIAMEMHDGVQGSLIALAAQLELISHVVGADPARAASLAREGREIATQAADELRFVVQRLRAPALAAGFVPSLRQYAHNVCARHEIGLEFLVDGRPAALDPEIEQALFRIAQEALTNVVKHTRAQNVWMRLRYAPESVEMSVRDDGRGFDEATSGGVGLAGMRERAEAAGGAIEIGPQGGSGTTILAMLPRRSV